MPSMTSLKTKKVLNILILEDNAADAELLVHTLKTSGLEFVSQNVSSKEEFIFALEDFKPDAIFADYSLPQFSGLNAFLIVKERGMIVPFILVTGTLPESVVIEVIKSGIDDYVLKENLGHLPTALQHALEKKVSERHVAELNHLREKFITIVAHQLRTPLAVMKWSFEKLLNEEREGISAHALETIGEAHEANQKLISRIDDLLTVITIEEGKLLVRKEEVDLGALLEPIILYWKGRCIAKGFNCEYLRPELSTGKIIISADPEKIKVVFEKILSNAFTYTFASGSIRVSLSERDSRARFEVIDTGIGIPEADQQNIFTSFFRAKNALTLEPDASGVGLSIAKYFVEQHKGEIGFTSKEGKGSTFWFEIPVRVV